MYSASEGQMSELRATATEWYPRVGWFVRTSSYNERRGAVCYHALTLLYNNLLLGSHHPYQGWP